MLHFLQTRLSAALTTRNTRPPTSTNTPGRPLPGATLLEHFPFEFLSDLADTFNEENTLTPAANPVGVVGLQNSRFRAAFREPMAAADLTLALWTAEPGREFTVALRSLAGAPPRQRGWCWDSVMPAITAAGTRNAHHVETMVTALVKNLPADPAIRLRLLRQAVDGLLRHPRGWGGALAPLLATCAAEPHLPDVVWQQLMRMVAKEPRHLLQTPAMHTAFSAISSPARRAEFGLAADIAQMACFGGTVAQLEGLLQRIGAFPPGPLASVFYDELFRHWRASGSRDSRRGLEAIRHAMLAAADQPGYREDALARLPAFVDAPPEVRAVLAAHAEKMRPAAAMQLVTRQMKSFSTDDPCRLPRQCAEILQRARAAPSEHLASTLTLARVHGMSSVDPSLARLHGIATPDPIGADGEINPLQTPEQRADLARLVLAEVPRLPLAHRLQVMAAIEPRDYGSDNWQEGWNRVWQESLHAICQGVLRGGLDITRRDAIRALAAALPHEQRRGRIPQPREGKAALPESESGPLLQALSVLLRDLPQHELAAALLEIQPMLPSHHASAGPSPAVVQLLLRCCESLPFELRAAPLDALEIATRRQRGGAKEAIGKLISHTRAEAAAWTTRSRALVQARTTARH
ncbi:hypothetical protein [Xylophilus sp. GOD-11R]|uniref:hypothetical protein n=1 Tax=Xylophilus sp. GOD-11R TaxID=3089814 RepID=UPI00298C6537|nr:hypothetical protein [Xylophilus sp. GOD-11R]WPB57970.1 hypothetical protein R9X41_04805 [Xylophilus sp. GOD-11R]